MFQYRPRRNCRQEAPCQHCHSAADSHVHFAQAHDALPARNRQAIRRQRPRNGHARNQGGGRRDRERRKHAEAGGIFDEDPLIFRGGRQPQTIQLCNLRGFRAPAHSPPDFSKSRADKPLYPPRRNAAFVSPSRPVLPTACRSCGAQQPPQFICATLPPRGFAVPLRRDQSLKRKIIAGHRPFPPAETN